MVIPLAASITFTCPVPPNKANARGHWSVGHGKRKAYWATLDTLVTLRRIPRPPKRPIPRAAVAVHLALFNPMDPDNLTARVKDLLDWLVSRGYLAGDRASQLDLTVSQDVNRTAPSARVTVSVVA